MKPAEQLLLLAGAIAAYIATFFLSYPILGAGVVGFSVVVPIAGGWMTGLRGGIASGLGMFPVNVALLLAQGEVGMYVMTHGGLTGTIILVVIGGVVGHLHDLQGRLRESEEKYRSIVENAQAGILIVGEDYRFIYVNDRLCEILGYPEEELIGEDFRTFLDEESRELVADRYKKRQRGEEVPSRYEFNIVRKKGEKRRVEISSTVITDAEGKKKTVAQILDITERKEAERRYRSVVENAHDAIYTIHPQRGFQYVNPAFEELTGYPASEIYSHAFSFWDIIHPDDVAMIEERKKARERGEEVPDRYEFRIIAKGGAVKTLEATTVDIGTGDAPLVMGILRDVTERERAIQEMKRALQLEKRFKADAAHFFLNPIAIAKGYMEIAMDDMPDECQEKITASRSAIKRVEKVIKNIVEKGEIHE